MDLHLRNLILDYHGKAWLVDGPAQECTWHRLKQLPYQGMVEGSISQVYWVYWGRKTLANRFVARSQCPLRRLRERSTDLPRNPTVSRSPSS